MDDTAEKYEVRNVSEDIVDIYLDSCIKSADVCGCARCKADIKAYALNKFPPHYVVTELGDAITRTKTLSTQFQADIITAIMHGILLVKQNPRH